MFRAGAGQADRMGGPQQPKQSVSLLSLIVIILLVFVVVEFSLRYVFRLQQIQRIRANSTFDGRNCQPGDIVFSSHANNLSNLIIELGTGCPFVHAGIVIERFTDDTVWIWDISPSAEYGKKWEIGQYLRDKGGRAAVLRTVQHLPNLDVTPFIDRKFEGVFPRLVFRWLSGNRPKGCDRMICVEMVMGVLQHNFGLFRDQKHVQSAAYLYKHARKMTNWYEYDLRPLAFSK